MPAPTSEHSPVPHRLAVLLTLVTLVGTVGLGATVTTLGAGMAFLDWPTSDGENMLAYNFLRDIRLGNTDKVVEHVHRLAGATTGLLTIGLVASLYAGRFPRLLGWVGRGEPRAWVRRLGAALLAGVVLQGLAGGFRVTEISTTLAMLHGHFAAVLVAAMLAAALVTSRGWRRAPAAVRSPALASARVLTDVALAALVLQYAAGGLVRHFGSALFEHLGGAVLVGLSAAAAGGAALATGRRFLRWNAAAVLGVLGSQLLSGMLAWASRFGVGAVGMVAVEHSPLQVVSRGGHTVFAMLLLGSLVLQSLRCRRLAWGPATTDGPARAEEPPRSDVRRQPHRRPATAGVTE